MGIIDKCGVRGDATLCVVIFDLATLTVTFDLHILKDFNISHNLQTIKGKAQVSYCHSAPSSSVRHP